MAQAKKAKSAAPKPDIAIRDLVHDGKVEDAVKLAAKSPAAASPALDGLMALADREIVDRDIKKAQATLEAAQKFADSCGKIKQVKDLPRDALRGRQLRLQGIMLSDQGQYQKAVEALNQALEVSQKTKDRALEAGVHNNLGFALEKQASLKETLPADRPKFLNDAVREYDLARRIGEEIKDLHRAGSSNYNLGNVLWLQTQYEKQPEAKLKEALAAFKRSVEQAKATSQTALVPRALKAQGRILSQLDPKSVEVLPLYQEAETLFEKLGDYNSAGQCYISMAEYSGFSGDFPKTTEFGEKAIPLFLKSGDKAALQSTYDFLAMIYLTMNEPAKSEKYKKLADELGVKK
ncbi:hypothetical protein EHM92_09080 [bacterium]|nr:MAG: hypothetical protein EHM92_09080 [bacterium]